MRDQAQVLITKPLFSSCEIMHGLGECTIDDKLVVAWMRSTLWGEEKIIIISIMAISIKDRA